MTNMPNDPPNPSINRLLDAAANRAGEALRVVEDYLRFVLDDGHLCQRCKQLRHDLAALLSNLSMDHRLAMRQTDVDVGTSIKTRREYQRHSAVDVLHANFARLEESLRSLEEFSKIETPDVAGQLEQLRYRTYTLHKAVGVTTDSIQRLVDARLYVLVDGGESSIEFASKCSAIVEAGAHLIQLRDKRLTDRELLDRANILRKTTSPTPTLFIMNDRPDLALLAGADGVHVGQEELPVHQARRIVGGEMLVGVSTHNIQQARQAVLDGANYIGVGPTFASSTKHFDDFPGLDFVRQVAAETRLPAFAIGGITLQNVSQVVEAGLSRVAVGAAIRNGDDVRRFLEQLVEPASHR